MLVVKAVFILLYLSWLAFACKRLLTYMHALQQEEYSNERFFRWILQYTVFDKRLSLVLLIIGLPFIPALLNTIRVVLAFAFVAFFEKDPRKDAKKKLVIT